MGHFLDFPPEVHHGIFQYIDTRDLASVSATCGHLRMYISRDVLLWKIHYLQRFDPPLAAGATVDAFWPARLQSLIAVENALKSHNVAHKGQMLKRVATMADDLLGDAPTDWKNSLNVAFLTDLMNRSDNQIHLMSKSSLFQKAGHSDVSPAETEEERQLSAKLNVLYGVSFEPPEEDVKKNLVNSIHPYARSRVYDLRRYKQGNFWGPFMDDGSLRVDWEKMQAVMVLLGYNLQVLSERTDGQLSLVRDVPFEGLGADSYVSRSLTCTQKAEPTSLDVEDPYGISGTWMRIVCFLDYNNLYQFNFENDDIPDNEDREPITTDEAIRLIFLKLKVTSIESPEEDDHPDMPVVHFTGTSRSMHMSWDPNANSKIRGTVRTTPSGAIRWTSFSIYHGEERWRSECVQVGGRKSSRGMLGSWFDKNYDRNGPAGPTAFWKLSDDVVESRSQHHHTFPFAAFF